MAYPNINPNFPQMYPNFSSNPYLNTQQSTNGINWVQGIEGAKAWQLQPNSNIVLLDSENDGRFYIKSSDAVGMCNLRVFKYEEITGIQKQQPAEVDLSEYVKKSELEALIKATLGGIANEQSVSTTDGKSSNAGNKKPLITK